MTPLTSLPKRDNSAEMSAFPQPTESFVEPLTLDLDIPCGKSTHSVAVNVLPWGTIEIGFNPCSLLPRTARRLAGCTCTETIEKLPTEFLRAYQLSLCTCLMSQEALSEHAFLREPLTQTVEWFRDIRVAAAEHVWYRHHHDFDEADVQQVFDGSNDSLLWSALVLLGARQARHHKTLLDREWTCSWPTQLMALWTLAQWNDPDTQALLLRWLAPEQAWPLVVPLRTRLARTLGQMGNHESIPVLKSLLKAPEPELCTAGEEALESILDRLGKAQPPCFSGLIDALSATSQRVVQTAQDTLIALGEPAVEFLARTLRTSSRSCSAVNRTLIAILTQLSAQEKTSSSLLLPLTDLEQGDVVNAAMRELTVLDPPLAIPLLYRLLATHASSGVRLMAAMKLGEVGNVESLAPLLQAVNTAGAGLDVSSQAADAVCRIFERIAKPGEQSVLPLLEAALATPNERVRLAAVAALGTIATSAVHSPLLRLCLSGEKSIARPAAIALGKIADDAILNQLKNILPYGDRCATEMAIEALVAAGARAVPVLLKTVKNQFPPARLAAVEALGRIGDARAGAVLHSAAKGDSDPRVRQAATIAEKKCSAKRI